MTDLMPFAYGDQPVRVVVIDSEPWFVLADLAKVLGIADVPRLRSRLDDGVRQTHPIQDSMGRTQQATIVNESGMYEVVIRSDKPEAVAFRRWITSEVLPSIRKTGSYGAPRELTPDEIVHQALQITAARVEELAAENAVLRPKADTWDALCSGVGDYTITDASKVLARAGIATGPRKLHQQMLKLGWLYKNQREKWTASQERVNVGHLSERVRHYIDDDGVASLATPQVRITARGLGALRLALMTTAPDTLPALEPSVLR